jgi:beta-lactamase superfamily II metal-dependent hydrolase
MDTLRVRVYNVRFGDAILISVPDKDAGQTTNRHILVDVGNVLSGEGGDDVVFRPVIENVLDVLNGNPLDLYVMTHEHLDHVQGLLYAAEKLGLQINTRYSWLTASSAPDYYDKHPKARKHLHDVMSVYDAIERFLQAAPEFEAPWLQTMMLNNNPARTKDCVDYLRKLADKTSYVHRKARLSNAHPFREARLKIWAPEEDTSAYYGRFQPMALGAVSDERPTARPELAVPTPPPGVDAGDFYNLVAARRHGYVDNLLAIDRAANNTSVVFSLHWRRWKLLFAGDAEHRSWRTMNKHRLLSRVHFLKVSHHGSQNGTPDGELLEKILPQVSADNHKRHAVVSAFPDTYNNVPHPQTLQKLENLAQLHSMERLEDGQYLDILFEG